MSETDGPKRVRKKAAPKGQQPQSADAAPGEDQAAPVAPSDAETEILPVAAPAAKGEPPRNPWASGGDDPGQRRSASIEDIFRSRGGGSGQPRGAPKPAWFGLAVLGVASAWLLSTSIHVLAQGERGVVSTFGRHAGTIGPGLNFTLPWPIQQVVRRDVGKEMVTLLPDKEAETLMLTRDGEVIDVRLQVSWRINDLRAFGNAFPDGDAALRRLADAAIRGAVAELGFDDVLGGKRNAELQQRAQARLQKLLDAMKAGITVSAVEVTQARAPAKLAETFKSLETATNEAVKNHENANKWAIQIRYAAQEEAQAFDRAYANYRLAPGVWRTKMYHETMDKVLNANTVVIGGPAAPAAAPQGGR
jgi:membrane protease subunit HflK